MTLVALLVLVPLLSTVVGLAGGAVRRVAAGTAVVGATLTAAIAVLAAFGTAADTHAHATLRTGYVPVTLALRGDHLTITVAVMVALVALAVQVYSVAYMEHDLRYGTYAALVSLFTAAMMLVVVADDLIVLLVGWEVMGICSYFLIGHLWEQPEARGAAVKAFLVTRLGDIGFLFGIFVLGAQAGTFRISQLVAQLVEAGPRTAVTVGTLLVLAGVVGKSAQFPLHVWLPDAMAGPTPISALIHAATMVAAGVFLVARLYPVFALAPATMGVLAVLACITMLGAALAALAQNDLKRVLAYSTASQLAYMFGGLAVGGYDAGLFHLLTHAAFKALLFLAAGSVIHAVGSNLLSDMGGLRRPMPVTFWTMTVAFAALAGLPPLAGFFSKESVLGAAEQTALHGDGPLGRWAGWLVLVTGLLTVLVTAAYVMRTWLLTFFGPRGNALPAHEPSWFMRGPLVALALPAAGLGVLALFPDTVRDLFDGTVAVRGTALLVPDGRQQLELAWATTLLSALLIVIGAFVMYAPWWASCIDPAVELGRLRAPFAAAFGVDAVYDRLVVRPCRALSQLVVANDRNVVDTYVHGAGSGAQGLGRLLRRLQRGRVQHYLTAVLAAVVLLAVAGVTLT